MATFAHEGRNLMLMWASVAKKKAIRMNVFERSPRPVARTRKTSYPNIHPPTNLEEIA